MRTWILRIVRALLAVIRLFAPVHIYRPPEADRARPRNPAACGIPPLEVERHAGVLNLHDLSAGGTYWADEIVVTGTNRPDRDLVLVAESRLVVDGRIGLLPQAVGDPVVHVRLHCRRGNVELKRNAVVTTATLAAPGESATAVVGRAHAKAGGNAGHVVMSGYRILIEGEIWGGNGGPGGDADAHDDPAPPPSRARGSAEAVAGCGGHGGDVVLCAMEFIRVEQHAKILGGAAGKGGYAQSHSAKHGDSYARGGDAGTAGEIRFEGHGGLCWVVVAPGGQVLGACVAGMHHGTRRNGGQAIAIPDWNNPNTFGDGGDAWASAGSGSKGGEIGFVNCRVDSQGIIRAGDGGHGGEASAIGGIGFSEGRRGWDGGNALARGGDGAPGGAQPQFRDTNDQPATGTAGDFGWGGNASSDSGGGGNANVNGVGGQSGRAEATGGANGAGARAQYVETSPQWPRGQWGGASSHAVSLGVER